MFFDNLEPAKRKRVSSPHSVGNHRERRPKPLQITTKQFGVNMVVQKREATLEEARTNSTSRISKLAYFVSRSSYFWTFGALILRRV